jgi:DNA-directed RNA polymerase beta subunit
MTVEMREFSDIEATRKSMIDKLKTAFEKRFPIDGRFTRLRIKGVEVKDKKVTKEDAKHAKLYDLDLTVPVTGQLELVDKGTDKVIDQRKMVLGHLPYIVPKLGTLIGNGADYSVFNQSRLLPGVYTRERQDGMIESQFNTQGSIGFRVSMDPASGQFNMNVGTNKLPLYPILKSVGVQDETLKKSWGEELLSHNRSVRTDAVDKFYKKLAGREYLPNLSAEEQGRQISEQLKKLRLDPVTTQDTLGKPFDYASPEAIVDSTKRILGVFKKEQEQDDRNSLAFKSFHSIDDFVAERVEKDSGGLARRLVMKLDKTKSLAKVPSSYFNPYFKTLIKGDDRAQPIEEVNPLQAFDNMHKNVVLGEGGIGSVDMVEMAARNIHPSQFGFIDPVRGPESEKIGIDTRFTHGTYKGSDKKIYARFINARTGKMEMLSPDQTRKYRIAFPGERQKSSGKLNVMYNHEIKTADKKDVDYYLPVTNDMFSVYSNMVPMGTAVQGNRMFMAGKALGDTLPLVNRMAPLVRSQMQENPSEDYETFYGKKTLVEMSPVDGEIVSVTKNAIVVRDKNGTKHTVDLFDKFPLGSKTMLDQKSVVKPGDKVRAGQVLCDSNFTDKNGTIAAGTHLLSIFAPYKGMTYEDGVVISQSAASKKLASEQIYEYEIPIDDQTIVSKKNFVGYFPTLFKRDQIEKVDENGLPKPGTKVYKDDPLITAIKEKTLSSTDMAMGRLHKAFKNKYGDVSQTWDHGTPGEVVYSVMTPSKAKVYVKTVTPMEIGDKLTGRYGNKGTVSMIVPDHEMPKMTRTGEPIDAIFNVTGILSRINPAQIHEGLLARVAKEKGKVYRMPADSSESFIGMVEKELKDNGMQAEEEVEDPHYGKIKTLVSYPYTLKLSKLADKIVSARGMSSYTSDMQPAKGHLDNESAGVIYSSTLTPLSTKKSEGGAVKIGGDLVVSLLAHDAKHTLKDRTLVTGQKNDEFWRAVTLGYPLPTPDIPHVYKKFEKMLTAAGAYTEKKGDMIRITPLVDSDISRMSTGSLKNARFLSAKTMEPEPGGLFDFGLTGGPSGEKWSHIDLTDPMPNPIMEESTRNIMGVTKEKFERIIGGQEELNGVTGGNAIEQFLSSLDLEKEIKNIQEQIPRLKKAEKDKAVKKLKALIGLRRSGKKPREMVLHKYPVIPPIFRPIAMLAEKGTATISDANKLYRDMFYANDVLGGLSDLPKKDTASERLNLYNSIKAVAGIDDPISVKNQESDVKGFIKKITGTQPKTGFFFDKLISKTQDLVSRGVAVLDAGLDMDTIRIPEKNLWTQYRPYIMRELVTKRGLPALQAEEMIETKHPIARDAMMQVLKERPIIMNRAPTLHRFSVMAFNAIPGKDKSIGTSPFITGPFGLDYDGDQLQTFVPATEHAVLEAKQKLMPSKNLFSIKTGKVHYMPPHEDIFGVYAATSEDQKNAPVRFKTIDDLRRAIKENRVDYSTRVIVEST